MRPKAWVVLLLAHTAAACTSATGRHGLKALSADAPERVHVPPGTFLMGNRDPTVEPPPWAAGELAGEHPAHEVRLRSAFWIDKYEVTNAAYQRFVDAGGYRAPELWSSEGWSWLTRETEAGSTLPRKCGGEEPSLPRVCVSWHEASAYARWHGGRLPTEAEWEYAARGPESRVFPWGDTFDPTRANVVKSPGLAPVGAHPQGASWVGAHDMSGNAMEWVQDWHSTTYRSLRVRDNPPGPATGTHKIEKGGWWGAPIYCARASYRHFEDPPEYADHHIGFRIVKDSTR